MLGVASLILRLEACSVCVCVYTASNLKGSVSALYLQMVTLALI